MTKTQLFALLSISLASAAVGNGIGTLIPVYAGLLGGSSDQIGFLMSAAFGGLAGGMLFAGRFSDRHSVRKRLLVASGALAIIFTWLIGQSVNMVQLTLFSVLSTFVEGIQLALVITLAGLHASPADRGYVFGLLGSAGSLGALLSGLAGLVVVRWGFPALCTAAALIKLVQALCALLVKDAVIEAVQQQVKNRFYPGTLFSRDFVLLFFSSIIAYSAGGLYNLARTLGMASSGFDTAAISSTVAVGGLITLPLPLLMGWLSDRIGRRPLLLFCYAAGAASLLILAQSTQLWQIWVSSALQAVMVASQGIGAALVTDLIPAKMLGAGLSLFRATNWIGLIIGSALTGAAIQHLGFAPALLTGALLALLTIFMVIPIRRQVFHTDVQTG